MMHLLIINFYILGNAEEEQILISFLHRVTLSFALRLLQEMGGCSLYFYVFSGYSFFFFFFFFPLAGEGKGMGWTGFFPTDKVSDSVRRLLTKSEKLIHVSFLEDEKSSGKRKESSSPI